MLCLTAAKCPLPRRLPVLFGSVGRQLAWPYFAPLSFHMSQRWEPGLISGRIDRPSAILPGLRADYGSKLQNQNRTQHVFGAALQTGHRHLVDPHQMTQTRLSSGEFFQLLAFVGVFWRIILLARKILSTRDLITRERLFIALLDMTRGITHSRRLKPRLLIFLHGGLRAGWETCFGATDMHVCEIRRHGSSSGTATAVSSGRWFQIRWTPFKEALIQITGRSVYTQTRQDENGGRTISSCRLWSRHD